MITVILIVLALLLALAGGGLIAYRFNRKYPYDAGLALQARRYRRR